MIVIEKRTLEAFASLTNRTPVKQYTRKRRDWIHFPVIFLDGGSQTELPDGATGILGIKEIGDFSGAYAASALEWVKEGAGAAAYYVFALNLNTVAINAKFTSDSVSSVSFALELSWTIDGKPSTVPADIELVVKNDYVQGGEGLAEDADPPWGLPSDYLTKAGNLAGLASTATSRTNLGLGSMMRRTPVALPAGFNAPGSLGDYHYDAATGRLWEYLGTQWGYTTFITAE